MDVYRSALMPEPPDFEQVAREIAEVGHAELDNWGAPPDLSAIVEQLRKVWNARGAADVERIVREIEGWQDGDEIHCMFDNDGDGRFDFRRLKITAKGRDALTNLVGRDNG